jgi:hypothetical protein
MRNNFFQSYEIGKVVYCYDGSELIACDVVSYTFSCNAAERRVLYCLIRHCDGLAMVSHEDWVYEDEVEALQRISLNRLN